ncbi:MULTISPECIES: hypothetical protein [unclassified Pseudonocardia]|uniref:hypothetical protein n=1 Tax=unclassified Pseudonocardia TaxID=2619320 RepID=UPI00096386D1|nr:MULTISPECIES: hypothetical protein [unclassified Pseudonocardia]MBN9099962.1 hypothetical protein [Pseudonocardia sp.]OJY48147.1 MAG: hypothetical protein BGP03_10855 [Pseudonocardia sp. 73-21]
MIITCPRCFSFDDVRPPRRRPDGAVEYTCTGEHDGAGTHTWSVAPPEVPSGRVAPTARATGARAPAAPRPGVGSEAAATDELLEPLLACVNAGEPFVEYGVVEYRFRLARPDLFVAHVRERGHVLLGARRGQASASTARFGSALRRLESAGELVMVKGPGTGAWRHNPSIGYWARPPRPTGPLLTWSMFCATQGRSAEWTDADRAVLGAP